MSEKKDAVQKYLTEVGGDGWSILDPQTLLDMGFSLPFVQRFSTAHFSGKDYKSTIFDKQGNKQTQANGVYALDFLYAIARDMGADTTQAESKMGRGFQAGCLCQAISAVLKTEALPTE